MNYQLSMKSARLIFCIALVFIFLNPGQIKAFNLSNDAEVSILTCSPGHEIYSVYGHSAIRVKDVNENYDMVFNYGIFDFSSPNFLYRFASGQTDYLLGIANYGEFYNEYVNEKRSILEQVLNLTQDEKQKIFNFLIWNSRPENRMYRYNFFFDNCATRIRDVIKVQGEREVIFPGDRMESKTLRDLIKEFHRKMLWLNFGIDLVIGSPADKNATAYEEMFLPDYLMRHFFNSKLKNNPVITPLVKSSNEIYNAPKEEYIESKITSPFAVFLFLTVLIMYFSFYEFRRKKISSLLDYIVYGITGLMGIIILWFVLYSEHPAMSPNYNLMWAIPLNLFFSVIWSIKKWRTITKYYHVLISVWLILFVVFGTLVPQDFHIAFYFFVLMIFSRSILHTITIIKESNPKTKVLNT